MQAITKYRFELDRTSKKAMCPACRQRRFVLYKDTETGEYLPEQVGRCDRENQCGYHYTPKQHFSENGQTSYEPSVFVNQEPVIEPKVDFLSMGYLTRSIDQKFYVRNNFYQFISLLFGELVAKDLFLKYLIGTAGYWKGAAIFPQIDHEGSLRQLKIMLHNPITGKRVKEGATVDRWDRINKNYVTEVTDRPCSLVYGKFLDESTKALNLEQCFFGQHLLTEHPEKHVCVVESEKTAMIASVYVPNFVWLATGGASGCKWREYKTYKVLQGRSVTFFPDYGYFNKKTGKTCFQEWEERCGRIREALPGTKIRVSEVLEKRLSDQDRTDQDLADMLLIRDEQTGIALTEVGYPIIFDYRIENQRISCNNENTN